MKAVLAAEDFPPHMRNHKDETWKQGKELLAAVKKALPRGKKSLASGQIPACLLQDCADLFELLIVVNFWLCIGQDPVQKDAIMDLLKGIYRAPTKSNQKLTAKQKEGLAAAQARANGGHGVNNAAPLFVGAADKQELLDAHAGQSAAAKVLQNSKGNVTKSTILTTVQKAMAAPMRRLIGSIEAKVCDVFKYSMNSLECLIVEPLFMIKRNVATPISKEGKSAAVDMLLPQSKTVVIVRNEAKFRFIVGEDTAHRMLNDPLVMMWHCDDHEEEMHTDGVVKKRKRDKVQSAAETRQGGHAQQSRICRRGLHLNRANQQWRDCDEYLFWIGFLLAARHTFLVEFHTLEKRCAHKQFCCINNIVASNRTAMRSTRIKQCCTSLSWFATLGSGCVALSRGSGPRVATHRAVRFWSGQCVALEF